MRAIKYPSDLTDEQWALVKELIPVCPGGRPRKTSMRDVLDAIFYLVRTGCQWRYLPKDFPPKSTVWRYFDEWRHNGTLEAIHDRLREKVRRKEGKERTPSAGSIDSQSVPAPQGGEQRRRGRRPAGLGPADRGGVPAAAAAVGGPEVPQPRPVRLGGRARPLPLGGG